MKDDMEQNIYDDASLLKKALLGETDQNERQELNKLLEKHSLKEVYDQLQGNSFFKQQFDEYEKYSSKAAFKRFYLQVNGKKQRSRFMIRWSGVAAVLLLAVTLTLWFTKQEWKRSLPNVADVIRPGEKRARLTLADGQVIEVAKKDISVQEKDGTQISYKDGRLSYDKGKDETQLMYNELEVPMGGEGYVVLADGTKVWLNAATKLRYPVNFVGKNREVYLEGEAYFDVVKDERQFVVKTAFGDVRVLGTAFGVEAYSSDAACLTTLVRGSVGFTTDGYQSLVIIPGEQVVASESGEMKKRTVNPEEYVGWKDGIYVFKEKPLGEIMKTLERWYDISVSFQPSSLREIPFTGNLKRYDSIDVFLDALKRTGDLQYKIEGKQVILFQ